MMRCLAVDDEPFARALLEDNIRQVPFLSLAASCETAMEALAVLREQPVDLVFLDIQMPGLTGLQLLQSLKERPLAILITAYEKFALEGFNLDVVDYLVKPVSFERFLKACNKAYEIFSLRQAGGAPASPGFFFVPADYGLVKVVEAEIVYIEGLKDYLKFHFTDGRTLIVRMTMKAVEEKLPTGFCRIHKSFLVAIAQVASVRKNSVFAGTAELPLGDIYREEFFTAIGQGKK